MCKFDTHVLNCGCWLVIQALCDNDLLSDRFRNYQPQNYPRIDRTCLLNLKFERFNLSCAHHRAHPSTGKPRSAKNDKWFAELEQELVKRCEDQPMRFAMLGQEFCTKGKNMPGDWEEMIIRHVLELRPRLGKIPYLWPLFWERCPDWEGDHRFVECQIEGEVPLAEVDDGDEGERR